MRRGWHERSGAVDRARALGRGYSARPIQLRSVTFCTSSWSRTAFQRPAACIDCRRHARSFRHTQPARHCASRACGASWCSARRGCSSQRSALPRARRRRRGTTRGSSLRPRPPLSPGCECARARRSEPGPATLSAGLGRCGLAKRGSGRRELCQPDRLAALANARLTANAGLVRTASLVCGVAGMAPPEQQRHAEDQLEQPRSAHAGRPAGDRAPHRPDPH